MFLKFYLFGLFLKYCDAIINEINEEKYSRMPPLFELEDYNQCLSAEEGLYCVVTLTLVSSPENDLMHMIREYSQHYAQHYNYSTIERGICVNKRCKQFLKTNTTGPIDDLKLVIERCLKESIQNEYELEAKVSKIYYCNRANDDKQMDVGDWIFGIVVISLIMINVFATLYDMRIRKQQGEEKHKIGNQYLLCFSVIQNWKWLISTEENDPSSEKFAVVHGIRVLSSFLMVFCHVAFIFGAGFVDNPHDFEKAYQVGVFQVLFSGTMLVQIYFLISGCLFTYSMKEKSKAREKWQTFPKVVFYRWCRLTPSLAVTLGFITTWFRHLGSGPLWNFYVTPAVDDCRQYWWTHILYLNNYVENNKCIIQTWHIAAEFQMFAVGLILYLATQSRGRGLAIFLMFVAGCVGPALSVWLHDFDGILILRPQFFRTFVDEHFSKMHILSHNNFSCYAIGMQLGLFLHYIQKKNIDLMKYKTILSWMTWITPPVMMSVCFFGFIFHSDVQRASLPLRMIYAAMHRTAFVTFLTIALIAIASKVEDVYRRVFVWRGWRLPSRLTYGVFLVHMSIVQYAQGTRTQLGHVLFFNLVIHQLGVVWLSYLLAVPLCLLVEAPMNRVVKTFFNNDNVQAKEKIK